MIYIQQHMVGGVSAWVLLAKPKDLSRPYVDLSVAYETEIEEGRTGVANRRPTRTVPRLTMSYPFVADEADLIELRNFFGGLGDEKVIVPLWFDTSLAAPALFNSQVKLGWNEGFANVAVGEGGSMPAGSIMAPAIVGRIERPPEKKLMGKLATVQIKVREESPWAQRLDIAAGKPLAFNWPADYLTKRPAERTRDRLEYETIGRNREESVSGDPLTTWKQEAGFNLTRNDLYDFLGWFRAHRGAFAAFTMPSFFKPGADTPQAPHTFDGTGGRGYIRFGSDVLKLSFMHSSRCKVSCEFEQVLDTTTEELDEFCRLFEIYSDADPGDIAYLTDNESPVQVGAQVYTPARIELKRFRSSLKLENDAAEIFAHMADIPQLTPIIRHETDIPVRGRVYNADLTPAQDILTTPISPTVNNGGFETPGAGGFDVFATWLETLVGTSQLVHDTTEYDTGSASAKFIINSSNHPAQVYMNPGTTGIQAGQTVQYTIRAKADAPCSILVGMNLAAEQNTHDVGTDWATITGTVENLTNTTFLIRNKFAANRTFWIDSVTLSIVSQAEATASATVLTFGRCGDWRMNGPRVNFSIKPFDGVLSRKIPRFLMSRNCNFSVFDKACARVNPLGMSKENWKVTGLFDTQWGANVVRIRGLAGVPGAMADNWFQHGWIEVGTGLDKQVRVIASSRWLPSGDGWGDAYGGDPILHLVLRRPVRTDLAPSGTAVSIFAGCDGSYGTCVGKFNNGNAYGGAPFAPSYITSKPRGMSTPSK